MGAELTRTHNKRLHSKLFFRAFSFSLPRSGECRSVAEDTERRLVITDSACLDKLVVDTDRRSASGGKIRQINDIRKCRGEHALLKGYIDLR